MDHIKSNENIKLCIVTLKEILLIHYLIFYQVEFLCVSKTPDHILLTIVHNPSQGLLSFQVSQHTPT